MSAIKDKIRDYFPVIKEKDLIDEIENVGSIQRVKPGTTIMDIGSYIKVMPLVTEGAIKVLREDKDGHELLLYFLYPGQSCAMTVQCCMANAPSQVRAIAEEETEFIAIPVDVMDEWMRKYTTWKNFVLTTYSERFEELLHTIDSVVFNQLDERLLEYLKQKASITGKRMIQTTHRDIAFDLHSSREVISRLLKQFEKHGIVKLGRNKIILTD